MMKPILEMVAMNGEDGVTIRELTAAAGKRVNKDSMARMRDHIRPLVESGQLVTGIGYRPTLRRGAGGQPVMQPTTVFRVNRETRE